MNKFILPLLGLALALSCAPPTAPTTTSTTTTSPKNSLSLTLNLHDTFHAPFTNPNTPNITIGGTGYAGEDRFTAGDPTATVVASTNNQAAFGLLVWVADSKGAYIDTISWFKDVLTGGTTGVYKHNGVALTNTTSGMAKDWIAAAGTGAAVDGLASATVKVGSPDLAWTTTWDCKDSAGNVLPAGNYVLHAVVMRHSNNISLAGYTHYTANFTLGTTSSQSTTFTETTGAAAPLTTILTSGTVAVTYN